MKPAHREATTKYFKLLHAQEEVSRLNVEVRRLRTFIHDKEIKTKKVINDLQSSIPLLTSELQRQWQSHSATNVFHIFYLNQIEDLPGYSGAQGIGVHSHIGGDLDVHEIIASEYADADIIQQEEHAKEMETMGSYLDSIVD